MKELILNWDKTNFEKLFIEKDKKHQKDLMQALRFLIALPGGALPGGSIPKEFRGDDDISKKFKEKRAIIEKAQQLRFFTTLNDFPASPKEVIDKFHELAVYDNFWESIFDTRDYTASRRDGFSMVTNASGLTFKKMLTGEKLEVFQMSGGIEYVYFDYYGGALNWDRKLFDNQDYWTIEENAIEFRNEAERIKAATFYALIEAVAGTKADIAWQAATPAGLPVTSLGYNAVRDANTLNFAAQTILLACQTKGYGVTAIGTPLIILCPVQLRGRLRQALDVTLASYGGSEKHIDYSFQLITSLLLTNTTHYWVILPKKKAKAGNRMDLTTFQDFDMLSYVDTAAGWMAFGGAIGDTDQFERCNIV